MSLTKFKKRKPFGNLITSDFFDMEDFFDNRFWNHRLLNDNFWNGRKGEPALNIKENDSDFEIELAAPGFAKNDFEITIDDGLLNITAEKSTEAEEEKDNYTRREFSYNAFQRSLQLPQNIKDEAVKAKYKDGILKFRLDKDEPIEKQKPKKIEIS